MAYRYALHVFCNECSVPHPIGTIELDELLSPDQNVNDIYDGREVPTDIVNMTNNAFPCPNTGRLFGQRDNRQMFLVRDLTRVEGQTFVEQDVRLDNHHFVNCTFTRCRFLYGATGPVGLDEFV